MSRQHLILAAVGGSALLLLGAFAFQLLGYAPCKLCLWQRWPHGLAILAGGLGLAIGGGALPVLGALSASATAGLGLYHTGVERGWWLGPSSCSGGQTLGGLSGADLLSVEAAAPVVMCDEVAWSLAGLSMASWNAALSAGLVLVWIAAFRRNA